MHMTNGLTTNDVVKRHDSSNAIITCAEKEGENRGRSDAWCYSATTPKETKELRQEQFVKTKLCKFYQHGMCSRRENCKFAHDEKERRPLPNLGRTKMCPTLETGKCYNPDCTFAHKKEELHATSAFKKTKMCNCFIKTHPLYLAKCVRGEECRYAHSEAELQRNINAAKPHNLEQDDNVAKVPATDVSRRRRRKLICSETANSSVVYYATYEDTPFPKAENKHDAYDHALDARQQQKRSHCLQSTVGTLSASPETSVSESHVMTPMQCHQKMLTPIACGMAMSAAPSHRWQGPTFFDGCGSNMWSSGYTQGNESAYFPRIDVIEAPHRVVADDENVVTPRDFTSIITAASFFGDHPFFTGPNDNETDSRSGMRVPIDAVHDANRNSTDLSKGQSSLLVKNTFLHFIGSPLTEVNCDRRTQSMALSRAQRSFQ